MSEIERENLNSKAVPFFARYLEGQCEELSEEETETVSGGTVGAMTKRYPSDQVHGGGEMVTQAYPSDSDQVHGGGGYVTYKYPSDREDSGMEIGDIPHSGFSFKDLWRPNQP